MEMLEAEQRRLEAEAKAKVEAELVAKLEAEAAKAAKAAADAQALRGMLVGEEDEKAWWRTPREVPTGGRPVSKDDPLTVLVAGGGLAGLVTAAACHAAGMRVALFEQASSYAPYGGPIQNQGVSVIPLLW